MYSQCPECQTRFRVTAEVLRAAHGTVRCGRCGSAFDALDRLSDMPPPLRRALDAPSVAEAGVALAALPDQVPAAEYHFTADDIEKVFIDAREWQKQFGADLAPDDTGSTPGPGAEPRVVVDESEPLEDITLEGERISIEAPPGFEVDLDSTDEFKVVHDVPDSAYPEEEDTGEVPQPEAIRDDIERTQALDYLLEVEPEISATPPRARVPGSPAMEPAGAAPVPEPVPTPAPAEAASVGTLAAQRWRRPEETDLETTAEETEPATGWRTLAWSLGCLVLAIALLAQVTHHFRQDFVRHPTLGPVVRGVYERLGLPLSPNWDLAAYELRQWGNGDGPVDGRLSIRASLTNRASFAQPHPVLRLQLDDRFGESIAVRDFEPAEYLKNPAEASRLLGPSASTEAELVIVSPGEDAVGYRLDVCLRESPTQLRCAQSPG
jgi:predicted Zn finger-like uncharacterized protein